MKLSYNKNKILKRRFLFNLRWIAFYKTILVNSTGLHSISTSDDSLSRPSISLNKINPVEKLFAQGLMFSKPSIAISLSRSTILVTLLALLVFISPAQAQLCSNLKDTVYGVTTTGQIYAINVTTGSSTTIGTPSPGANKANAMGFSNLTGSFYFFNKTQVAQEFVSYNPINSVFVVLANSPIPVNSAISSGCVNNTGNGYYAIDTSITPSPHMNLNYYNIPLNTWKRVSTSFVDASNNPIPTLDTLLTGDITIDGKGNLWILRSSSYNYALFKVNAPLPTAVTGPIKTTTVIPLTTIPPPGFGKIQFTGVAFNSLGSLYATTGNTGASGNRIYPIPDVATGIDFTAAKKIPADAGTDLATCAFPIGVLPIVWNSFQAGLKSNTIELSWHTDEEANVSEYLVEQSLDNTSWQILAHIPKKNPGTQTNEAYYYTSRDIQKSVYFYRVLQIKSNGKQSISETKRVSTGLKQPLFIGPNPTTGIIYLGNKENTGNYFAQVYSSKGDLIYSKVVNPNSSSIDLSFAKRGLYILKLYTPSAALETYRFIKL